MRSTYFRCPGAPANFTVRALAAENSRMNDLIDEPTVNDLMALFFAMSQGMDSGQATSRQLWMELSTVAARMSELRSRSTVWI